MSVLFFQNHKYPNAITGPGPGDRKFHHDRGVAWEGSGGYFCSGINEGGNVLSIAAPHPDFKDLRAWVDTAFGDQQPIESPYVPGTCFKRIWRPLVCSGTAPPGVSMEKVNESYVALRILLSKLEELFETVEPSTQNETAYGHKIREVLLLACMEVESAWSAVLRENGYVRDHFTTNDYVTLCAPMFLDAYSMRLSSYSGFPVFCPFHGWDATSPTKSLRWYDAYNRTKHDREGNLHLATLSDAIHAVGAAVVMVYAQFGFKLTPGSFEHRNIDIRSVFNTGHTGIRKYEQEFYIPKLHMVSDSPRTIASDPNWNVINYHF